MILIVYSKLENSETTKKFLNKSEGIQLSGSYLLALDISKYEINKSAHFYLKVDNYIQNNYQYYISQKNIENIEEYEVPDDIQKIEIKSLIGPKDFGDFKIIYFDIEKKNDNELYIIILINNIKTGYITNTQYDESKINELSINSKQSITFNENHAFIMVKDLTNLNKISIKYESKNNLEKADIKVYFYNKLDFLTFDEIKEDKKIEFQPYQIINENNYYYYYSFNQLNNNDILLYSFHINDNIDKIDFMVKEGDAFFKEITIADKNELKFEKDINYYFYSLSDNLNFNYLFKYNKDLNPKIYYSTIKKGEIEKRFNLQEIKYTTKEDNSFYYSYSKIKFESDFSKLYLIFYNNDNETLFNKSIFISINQHDLSSYEQMDIYTSKKINLIKDEEKIITIGDLDYDETFYINIIYQNNENLNITLNLFNKNKNVIYEITNNKSLSLSSQLILENNKYLYYNSLNTKFNEGKQSIMFIFNAKNNLNVTIESVKNDENEYNKTNAGKYEEKKIKTEKKRNSYISYNISSFNTSTDIYYEFSGNKSSFNSTNIFYSIKNTNLINDYLLDFKNLTTCKSNEEKNNIIIYCNYTKQKDEIEIAFIILMNENSEIKVNNTEKSGYEEKSKDSDERHNLYSKIFIIIGIVILVIIAIIIIICFVKGEQLDSSTIEEIKGLNL